MLHLLDSNIVIDLLGGNKASFPAAGHETIEP